MVESDKATTSSYVLQQLAENGSVVYFCNGQHIPCGVLLPFNSHSRQLKILETQLAVSKPQNKRLWQQIVQQKILNQAECLNLSGKEGSLEISSMVKRVQSGDSSNIEAQVAAKYFRLLFGTDFRRQNHRTAHTIDTINASLNYGYSIIRAAIARTLVVYGFETCLGIFHHNETNNYNLADDLLEPYRPLVDLFTVNNLKDAKLTPSYKRQLYSLLNYEIVSGKERHSVMYSIERLVKSLNSAYQNKAEELILPELCVLKIHTYE